MLATNENDVLDEFFRTGVYRVRSQRRHPRDLQPLDGHQQGEQLRALRVRPARARRAQGSGRLFGEQLATKGQFDLSAELPFKQAAQRYGFVSGKSTHADRLATIRDTHERFERR